MTSMHSPFRTTDPEEGQTGLAALVRMCMAQAPYDGFFDMRVPGVFVSRASAARKEMAHGVIPPALCLVAQGAKRIILGKEIYDYDASRMMVYSMDVPVAAKVTQASLDEPYLGIRIDIDPARIAELTAKVYADGLPKREASHAIRVDQVDDHILNAVVRLMGLASQPGEVELLASLIRDEIFIRLLNTPLGQQLALIGQEKSKLHRISKAVSWVRSNFDKPLDVERLATLVHMSTSSFHQHFKAVTELSPLQYQKALRLQEARRLMLVSKMDAGSAGRTVGYQSVSQFTREYGRYFGNAPTRDIALLIQKASAG